MRGRLDNLRRIESLDPATDHEEIFRLTTRFEFPWDIKQGAGMAFLRDFGVPSISALLHKTGEFEHRGQKRYDDTLLITLEATEESVDSERGRATIRHLNRIHGRYDIPNEEFRYVLATTIVGPKRWIDEFGWRPLHPHEIEAWARVTARYGELMGIKDVPTDYPGFEHLLEEYEAEHFAYAPQNEAVAEGSLAIVAGWFPRPLRPLVRRALISVLDEPLRVALGLPEQPPWLGGSVRAALRARAVFLRRLAPPRPPARPYRHRARTYPDGFTLAMLGPFPPERSGSGLKS